MKTPGVPRCALFLYLLLCTIPLCAAQPYQPEFADPVLESWRWRVYDELKGQGLRCLTQSTDGAMWFGVDDGVRRYDGLTWTAFTSETHDIDAPINTLCATDNGNLYAGSNQGISQYQNGKWSRLFPPREVQLPWPVHDIIEATDGSFWAATAWGALHFNAYQTVLHTTTSRVKALGIIWPEHGEFLQTHTIPNNALPNRRWIPSIGINIDPITQRAQNQIPPVVWAVMPGSPAAAAGIKIGDRILEIDGSDSVGLIRLFGKSGTPVTLRVLPFEEREPIEVTLQTTKINGMLKDFYLNDILEDKTGHIWFGICLGGEIVRYDPNAKTWTRFDATSGLPQGQLPQLAQTQDGKIWSITRSSNGQVSQFDGKKWININLQDKLGENTKTKNLYHDMYTSLDGTLWIGATGWLFSYKNDSWHAYHLESVNPSILTSKITDFYQTRDGAIWMAGLGQEAIRFDISNKHWQTFANLSFNCETPDGSQWFLTQTQDHALAPVQFDGQAWKQYSEHDGLPDSPTHLFVAPDSTLWVTGSHQNIAATGKFDGQFWTYQTHPQFSSKIGFKATFPASDGTLWFGTAFPDLQRDQTSGLLRFDPSAQPDQQWKHFPYPQGPLYCYGIGETTDGRIWFGGNQVGFFDGDNWVKLSKPWQLARGYSDAIYSTSEGQLWVGHRSYGAFHFDGENWAHYDVKNGLPDNRIRDILQTLDGSIWMATARGICRFDGHSWTTNALPRKIGTTPWAKLYQLPDSTLWISDFPEPTNTIPPHTVRYISDRHPPQTTSELLADSLSYAGIITLTWRGVDPWNDTPKEQLQYAWRLNGSTWSHFSKSKLHTFQQLPARKYLFEVKARDRDFNEDPTPATVQFTILPPIYHQTWFIGLIVFSIGLIMFQTFRIISRDRRLSAANQQLRNEIVERTKLDARLRNLHYLYTLRTALAQTRSAKEAIQATGENLLTALGNTASKIEIHHHDNIHNFGQAAGSHQYQHDLNWDDRTHGQIIFWCNIALSESQQRDLRDETAALLSQILEAQELQFQLLQSARLVSLGEMAAGVAHELNQPLDVLSTIAEDVYLRLSEDLELTKTELQAMMKDELAMVERLSNTIDHLRTFSRDTAHEPGVPFNINDAIHASLQLIEAQLKNRGIQLQLDLHPNLPEIVGHPQQIEQVFINLIANARDAIEEHAEKIAPHNSDQQLHKRISIQTRIQASSIIAEIEDSGIGISSENQPRIFEPFYTTKPADRGTGLGLSITYAIVKNHAGKITCESIPKKGTIFHISLPVCPEEFA